MAPRLEELYRVLKPTGSFYIHCDPTASHYLKVFLDGIFGIANFRNEIVWRRTGSHNKGRRYGPIHDTVLFYTKSSTYTWNCPKRPYMKGHIDEFFELDERGYRTKYFGNVLTGSGTRGGESGQPWRGFNPTAKGRHWAIPRAVLDDIDEDLSHLSQHEKLDRLLELGYIKVVPGQAWPVYERYLKAGDGQPLSDIWAYQPYTEGTVFGTDRGIDEDVRWLTTRNQERRGYPTQKPLALLERIIAASSAEGDTVLDAFCGCGTTLEAAVRLIRRWIGIDFSPTACRVMARRLEERCHLAERQDFRLLDLPRSKDELRRMPPLEFENWAVTALGGIPNRVKRADFGIDGRLYVADRSKPLSEQRDLFGRVGAHWFPIQVKQKDKAGRPDIDLFVSAMHRDRRERGYFVSFGYTRDADVEIRRLVREDGLEIVPVTVDQILADETALYGEPPAEISVGHIRRQSVQRPVYDATPPEEPQSVTEERRATRNGRERTA